LTSRVSIEEASKTLLAKLGRVDILVNNAGIVSGKPFLECAPESIERTMDVNINAHFWTCRSFLPGMVDRKHGHVVTIASMAGHLGVPGLADYAASKFAAVGFDESIRVEMKKFKTNVKTTCVCPYYISTGMFEGVKSKLSFLMPIMTPDYVATQIVAAVKRNDEMLLLPWTMNTLAFAKLFPIPVQDWIANIIGTHSSMDQFVGRAGAQKKNQ
jgi:all-trans-retinol dehydrogenase (NAD+)